MGKIILVLAFLFLFSTYVWCDSDLPSYYKGIYVDVPSSSLTMKECIDYSKGVASPVDCKNKFVYKGVILTTAQMDKLITENPTLPTMSPVEEKRKQEHSWFALIVAIVGFPLAWIFRKQLQEFLCKMGEYSRNYAKNHPNWRTESQNKENSNSSNQSNSQSVQSSFSPSRTAISDNVGKVIAFYEDDEHEIRLVSNVGYFIGKYIKSENRTYDNVGRFLNTGNTLGMLIPRE